MKTPIAGLYLGAALTCGCSDATGPEPGTFRAQLSGARVAAMAGPSNAGLIYGELPGARFAIRMFAPQGDTVRVISIQCPGEDPPAPGTHAVSASEADCVGSYARIVTPPAGETIVLEQASASSGSVTISASTESLTTGSFNFDGILVLVSDSVGTVAAEGEFSAEVVS